MTPLNPIVAGMVSRLDQNLLEAFEERAGIMEFEASQPRALAECLALLDVIRTHPLALTGVTAFVLQRDGKSLFGLTTSTAGALQLLQGNGTSIVLADLPDLVKQLGGTVRLTRLP